MRAANLARRWQSTINRKRCLLNVTVSCSHLSLISVVTRLSLQIRAILLPALEVAAGIICYCTTTLVTTASATIIVALSLTT